MKHHLDNSMKPLWPEWHRERTFARRTASSEEEFSREDRTDYNLDSDDRHYPGNITGEDNPETYITDPMDDISRESVDIRELDHH